MSISLGYIGKKEGESIVRNLLKKNGYICGEIKKISYGIQFPVEGSTGHIGYIRIFEKKSGKTTVDFSAILFEEDKMFIESLISNLQGYKRGRILLPQRFFFNYVEGEEPLLKIKEILVKDFNGIEIESTNGKIYAIIKLDGVTVVEYKNGTVLIQGKTPTQQSDTVINVINDVYEESSRKELLRILKFNLPFVKETEYEEIFGELRKYKIDVDAYISKKAYSYLNPNDRVEIRDGLLLFQFVKNKKLPLKNFATLVRNFAIAYEGFLIKFLSDLEILDVSKILTKPINVGAYLKPHKDGKTLLEKKYPYISKKKPALPNKMWVYWQECRNDYLHSDFIKLPLIKRIETAESKIREIISIIEDCLDIFEHIISPTPEVAKIDNKSIIGIDESGKGDYFGPLVIAAVFVDEKAIKTLSSLGIRDSKLLSDSRIKELYKEIKSRCKVVYVKISPEKYNELYGQIGNLNQLLAWGHARALENMLSTVKCKYALSDKFGDENLIKSRLMQQGKRITLLQKPRAERNIAVASASIVARYIFLESLERMNKIYKMNFPKGASSHVEEVAKKFVKKYGKNELKKVAKIHFKTTERVLNDK